MNLNRPLRLRNKIQEYDWGSRTAIPSILGLPKPSKVPMAELWMGAHPKAPSEVEIDSKWIRLDELISKMPEPILGEDIAAKFSKELPFLFKIIAAEMPLSIQVHPNKEQAIKGFEKENKLKIPLDSPKRNYKDKNHKPELLCAISEFEVLKGFRPIDEIIYFVEKAVPLSLRDELDVLKENKNLKVFYTAIMRMEKQKREKVMEELLDNAEKLKNEPEFSLVLRLNRFFPKDIGVLSPLILNYRVLKPGEAIFLPACQLHAYIKGVGMEIMANSDNVIRGGLTHKHVDVDELLNILDFESMPFDTVSPTLENDIEFRYLVPAEEFLLSVISLEHGKDFISSKKRSVEIIFVLDGSAIMKDHKGNELLKLKRGDSFLIPSVMPPYSISGKATIYKASVPL